MHTTTSRTQHGTTPVTADVAAWLDRTYPEGDAYIVHDDTCDAASCGDECEGGCPVYVDDDEPTAEQPATEHTCHGAIFCGQPRAVAQAACPACTPARPLLEVLEEHVDQVRAQRLRRQALEQIAQHALPADAPGAWIRKAIAAELNPTTEETR
jgi:hypothetical protein